MAKNGTLKFISATAAGAIIGVLAVRAFDKHILKSGAEKEPEQLPEAPGPQQPMMMGMGAAPVMPVFLPTSPFMAGHMGPPMSVPPPPTLGAPAAAPPVSEEEADIVDEIEAEWAD